MTQLDEAITAFTKADAAGDTESAALLAKHVNELRKRTKPKRTGFGGVKDIIPGAARGVASTIGLVGDLDQGIDSFRQSRLNGEPDLLAGARGTDFKMPTSQGVKDLVDADGSLFEGGEDTAVGRASEFAGSTLMFGLPGLAKKAITEGATALGLQTAKAVAGGGAAGIGSFYGEEVAGTKGAIIGSFVPATFGAGIKGGIKTLARGSGKANQVKMAQNIREARMVQAVPTLGSVSPTMSRGAAVERIVESVPGGHAPLLRVAEKNAIGLQARLGNMLGNKAYKEDTAGLLIHSSLKNTIDKIRTKSASLYSRADKAITNRNALIPIRGTRKELSRLSAQHSKSEFDEILNSVKLQDDIAGRLLEAMNNNTAASVGVMTWDSVNNLRKIVGQQISLRNSFGDPAQGILKKIYGALSNDVQGGALLAGGPKARQAFKNANNYWKKTRVRVDRLIDPMLNKNVQAEMLFRDVVGASLNKPTKLALALKGMNGQQKEYFAKTFIAKLGNIDDTTGKVIEGLWSPGRLIRNWERIPASQKTRLFSGTPELAKLRVSLDKYMKVLARQKKGAGVLANPSGTAGTGLAAATLQSVMANLGKIATLGIGGAAVGGAAGSIGLVGAAMGGANLSSRLMGNPRFLDWLARASVTPMKSMPPMIGRLSNLASTSDPDMVQAIDAFNSALMIELQAQTEETP